MTTKGWMLTFLGILVGLNLGDAVGTIGLLHVDFARHDVYELMPLAKTVLERFGEAWFLVFKLSWSGILGGFLFTQRRLKVARIGLVGTTVFYAGVVCYQLAMSVSH